MTTGEAAHGLTDHPELAGSLRGLQNYRVLMTGRSGTDAGRLGLSTGPAVIVHRTATMLPTNRQ